MHDDKADPAADALPAQAPRADAPRADNPVPAPKPESPRRKPPPMQVGLHTRTRE